MHEVLVNRLGGLSLPRKSVVRLTDHPDMTLDVYRGRKTTMQQQQQIRMPVKVTAQQLNNVGNINTDRMDTATGGKKNTRGRGRKDTSTAKTTYSHMRSHTLSDTHTITQAR